MTRSSQSALVFFSVVASAIVPARPANAAVIILNGGMAQMCYEMTRAVSLGDDVLSIQLTGSLIGISPIEVCTMAIKENDLVGFDRAGTYNNRGVLYFAEQRFDEAIADFERGLRVDQGIAELHVNHGAAMVALKRWAEGIASLNKGIEMMPLEPEKAYYNRAIAHDELGHVKEAYYDYRKALELKPEWEQPKIQLTRFQVRPVGAAK